MNKLTSGGVTKGYFHSTRRALVAAKALSKSNAETWGESYTAEVFTGHSLITFKNGKRAHSHKVSTIAEEQYYY